MSYDRLVILDDRATSISALAAGTISGGELVGWISGANSVNAGGSVASAYKASQVVVVQAAAATGNGQNPGPNIIGVAQNTVTSGNYVNVFMQGTFMLPTGSNGVSGGLPLVYTGYGDCVESVVTGSNAYHDVTIGRALSQATAAGNFVIARINV